MKTKRLKIPFLSRWAVLYLRIVLPITVLSSVTLLIFCLQKTGQDPVLAKHACRPLVEYPLSCMAIAAGGGVLIDYIERSGK